jgi:regulator of protease activity HflC (stomatin/prohibitin superfamily)
MDTGWILLILAIAAAGTWLGFSVRLIKQYERGVVERLGKFYRELEPGFNVIMPVIDVLYRVDMREKVFDVPPQLVITSDNVSVEVDGIIYLQVTDPVRAVYETDNYLMASTKLAQTNLRNLIGEMDLDHCLASRDEVNRQLRDVVDKATDKWGVRVNRVELQRIDPPKDITEAMSRQMKAEREKRAKILESEADRQSAINRAEGSRTSQVLEAEGYAEAVRKKADAEKYRRIAEAEGESQAIANVFGAIHAGKPDDKLVTLKYLEMLPKLADNKANKIFLPYEASGMISTLAAMIEGIRHNGGVHTAPGATSAGDELADSMTFRRPPEPTHAEGAEPEKT